LIRRSYEADNPPSAHEGVTFDALEPLFGVQVVNVGQFRLVIIGVALAVSRFIIGVVSVRSASDAVRIESERIFRTVERRFGF